MVGKSMLIRDLLGCTSDLLQVSLQKLAPGPRAGLVRLQTKLVESICEELEEKYAFHDECPYSCIRIFYGETFGGDTAMARAAAKHNIEEYDKFVADGLGNKLQRVAHKIYGTHTECRRQLELFGLGFGDSLKSFPIAYVCVARYALGPIVGRRVEQQHALIKQLGLQARNVQPPWISAGVSCQRNLERLRTDPKFNTFVIDRWRSKALLNDTLHLVVPESELRDMTRT